MTTPAPTPAPTPSKFPTRAVTLLAVGVLAMGGVYAYSVYSNRVPAVTAREQLSKYVAAQSAGAKLAAGYADANGNLVADAPTDPAKFVNPAELTFTAVVADDPDKAEALWKPLMEAIAKKTGKKVTYLKTLPGVAGGPAPVPAGEDGTPSNALNTVEAQMGLLRAGKLHVTALSTGQVAAAVNAAGFVPLVCPATADGQFTYEAEVIVPADSPAKSVADLRGPGKPPFAFTALSSNSGAKAPLVAFKREHGMLPGRDYDFVLTGGHDLSILGVCYGRSQAALRRAGTLAPDAPPATPDDRYPLACVAGDLLAQMVAAGTVKASQYRTLSKSASFPPLCFGVPHDLDPKLRQAIEAAFTEFRFEGTPVGERYKAQGRVKFAPVNYLKDWKDVRDIDDQLGKLLD